MSLFDLTQPKSLFGLGSWPNIKQLDGRSEWILPLDVVALSGGPLAQLARALRLRAEKNPGFWKINLVYHRAFLDPAVVGDTTASLRKEAMSDWVTPFASLEIRKADYSLQELEEWRQQIFSSVTSSLNLKDSQLSEYQKAVPEVGIFPWEGFRFYPGFLRQKGFHAEALLAARDLARWQVLFSPQDEVSEKSRLENGQLALNPTAQILPQGKSVCAIYRRFAEHEGYTLCERELDWIDALVIDEIREGFRASKVNLLASLDQEIKGHSQALGGSARTLDSVLVDLGREGLVLLEDERI